MCASKSSTTNDSRQGGHRRAEARLDERRVLIHALAFIASRMLADLGQDLFHELAHFAWDRERQKMGLSCDEKALVRLAKLEISRLNRIIDDLAPTSLTKKELVAASRRRDPVFAAQSVAKQLWARNYILNELGAELVATERAPRADLPFGPRGGYRPDHLDILAGQTAHDMPNPVSPDTEWMRLVGSVRQCCLHCLRRYMGVRAEIARPLESSALDYFRSRAATDSEFALIAEGLLSCPPRDPDC